MKSNKQYTFFNKHLYKEGLRQLMLLGFVCMGLIALITVCIPISSMLAIKSYSTGTIYPEIVSVGSTFLYLYSIFIFVTPMLSLTTFHFLTKRNSSDVYHATPCTRGCIFNTYFACIVTWIIGILSTTYILSAITYTLLSGYITLNLGTLFVYCISMLICSLIVATAIAFACSITGTIFTNVIVSGLILFLPRIISTIIVEIISSNHSVLVSTNLLPLLDNNYNPLFSSLVSIFSFSKPTLMSPLTLSYGLILATIYLFISRTLFIRRKSESAGQATAGRRLQSTIRIAIGFPLCLFPLNEIYNVIIGNSTNGPAIFSCFLFYIIAILAMFIYELISTKKASELKRVFPSIASLFVLNVLCLGVIYVLFQSQLRYNPDPSDIKYVQIMQNEYDYYDNNYFNKRANDFKIQDENIIKLLSKSLTETLDYEKNGYPHGQQYDVLVVGIRSGYSTKNRRLYLSSDVYSEVMNYLMTCKEIQNIYTDLPDYNSSDIVISTELQSEDSIALYKSLQQEVKTIDPTVWYNEVRNLNCSIALYCNVNYDDSQMYMQLPLTTLTPKTLLLYLQYSNKLVSTENISNTLSLMQNESSSTNGLQFEYDYSLSAYYDSQNSDYSDFYLSYYSGSMEEKEKGNGIELLNSIKETYSQDISSLQQEGKQLVNIRIWQYGELVDRSNGHLNFYAFVDTDTLDAYK